MLSSVLPIMMCKDGEIANHRLSRPKTKTNCSNSCLCHLALSTAEGMVLLFLIACSKNYEFQISHRGFVGILEFNVVTMHHSNRASYWLSYDL